MTHPYLPPPIETATDPIHSTADMGQRWRALMGELGFGQRLLWVGFVGPDRRMIKALSQVELRATANADLADEVMTGVRDVLADFPDGTSVALLLTRPGVGPVSGLDRQWAALLIEAARRHRVDIEPIFRAHDESLDLLEQVPVGR
ncbi:hypothetical protein H7J88_07215 [Mycolicibacterium flavescens]|uniref:Uncharacterized protein n=1 Tax=Mycolicibacterium flavescens TaxID=1776 RepID=A0A1E3RQI0_MYCFV|nr:hypothetical protein [Mycolicibacterium flavescens]MCV7279433.1 hypothetical protein [Mycolicibacterium flavescens]ODQ92109.1 hypothetical protein BHQ18_03705 [Mycolicibacterium flavescens]